MSFKRNTFIPVVALASAMTWTAITPAGDWPTFRGPNRTSVTQNASLLQEWPSDGPKLVWDTSGAGRGYASVSIQGDKLFTLGDGLSTASDKDEYLSAFNLATGKQLWKTKTGNAWNEGPPDWQSSRSTPTVDGDRVYVITPHGKLVAANTKDGKIAWQKSLKDDFGGKKGDGWGYGESPLIDGDLLICTPGGESTTMIAVRKSNGAEVWKCQSPGDRGAGHSSIVISQIGKTKIYVQSTASGAIGVRAKDGKLLWSFPIDNTTCVIPTPIIKDDLVFYSVGYGRGGALLRQVPTSDGATIETVYGLNNKLANKHGGVVLVGDYLYADSDDAGIPFCADLKTGEQLWKKRGAGKGSAVVISADNKLYVQYASGELVLADASKDDYHEISHFKIPGSGSRPSWAHPVILDGRLYVRQDDNIMCYDIHR